MSFRKQLNFLQKAVADITKDASHPNSHQELDILRKENQMLKDHITMIMKENERFNSVYQSVHDSQKRESSALDMMISSAPFDERQLDPDTTDLVARLHADLERETSLRYHIEQEFLRLREENAELIDALQQSEYPT